MRARVFIVVAGAWFAALAAPAAGQMSVALKVFEDFATDGIIDPCKHSSEELQAVAKFMPPDIEQYAPEYPEAVDGALEARARGDCAGTKPQAPVAIPTASPTPTPTPVPTAIPTKTVVEDPPAPEVAPDASPESGRSAGRPDVALERAATARPANGPPAAVLLLALLGGALLATTLALLASRRVGWAEGAWHAWSEAAYRAGGVWQDFRDWLRLGR